MESEVSTWINPEAPKEEKIVPPKGATEMIVLPDRIIFKGSDGNIIQESMR